MTEPEQAAVGRKRRKSVQRDREETEGTVKRTFVLDPDLDSKLDLLARRRKMSRSDVVGELLRRETRFIVIQYRSGDPSEDIAAA